MKSKKTIGIVGSSGYISNFLIKSLNENNDVSEILKLDVVGDVDYKVDLSNTEKFDFSCLDGVDEIIFTAAISGPDKCANDFDFAWNINVHGTSHFIQEALNRGCRVLFFSSDAAFGDIPGKIYDEDSPTQAKTAYGRMKKAVEDQFKRNPLFKAIRLSYVASARDRFISYCLKCKESGEIAEIFHPFYRNCTTVSDVVSVVTWLTENWEIYEPTFLNVAGTELVSRVRMADEINRYFNNQLQYKIVQPEQKFYENRPAITQMRSLYLYNRRIVKEESFTEKIQKELRSIEL